jgi:hypothetical protein
VADLLHVSRIESAGDSVAAGDSLAERRPKALRARARYRQQKGVNNETEKTSAEEDSTEQEDHQLDVTA